jgi:hypothetical protein
MGMVLRYTDINNFLAAYLVSYETNNGLGRIVKVVGGTVTVLATGPRISNVGGVWLTLDVTCFSNGQINVRYGPQGSPSYEVAASDETLATGGVLASGKVGLVDWNSHTTAPRTYDNFAAWTTSPDAVVYANQSAELSTSGIFRADVGGTAYGPVSIVNSDLPRMPNKSSAGTVEVFVKSSRGDLENLPDPGIDDISARVYRRASWLTVDG